VALATTPAELTELSSFSQAAAKALATFLFVRPLLTVAVLTLSDGFPASCTVSVCLASLFSEARRLDDDWRILGKPWL